MRAIRLAELQELLQGSAFTSWWADLGRAVADLKESSLRRQDLESQAEMMDLRSELAQRAAMDTFSGSGEAEEASARHAAEAQDLENRALALVALYEEQRYRSSELWYRLGGLERSIEEAREAVARARADQAPEARARQAQAEAALQAAERQHRGLKEEFGAEDSKRDRLWVDVEETWTRSFERSLLAQEHGERSRRIRRESERLFKEAEERRARARQLRVEAEAVAREHAAAVQRHAQLMERARQEFGCAPGPRFLYWRHRDDKRAALAVALVDDAESYGVEVKALSAWTVGPVRGVSALEPAREGLARTVEEGDRRFEEFLLGPRQGLRRGDGEPGPGGGS